MKEGTLWQVRRVSKPQSWWGRMEGRTKWAPPVDLKMQGMTDEHGKCVCVFTEGINEFAIDFFTWGDRGLFDGEKRSCC